MKPNLYFCIFAMGLGLGLGLGQAAIAQGIGVTSKLVAQRIEMADGKAVVKPAGEGKPGEIIEYTGTYSNGGVAAADKLLATIPVPVGTSFIAGSSKPALAQASTDGTRFAPMPLMRSVKQTDGSERKEPVPLSDYRAVRWEVGTLSPGSSSVVGLRVRIDAPVALPPLAKP